MTELARLCLKFVSEADSKDISKTNLKSEKSALCWAIESVLIVQNNQEPPIPTTKPTCVA